MQKPIATLVFLILFATLRAQQSPCLSLYVSTETAAPGEEVCLEVSAGAYDGLLGVLFELRWDTSVLAFRGVENIQLPYLYEYNFNLLPEAVGSGFTVLSWYDPSIAGISLPEGAPLFSLCFEVAGQAGDFGRLSFAKRNGDLELADANANAVDAYSLINGGVYVSQQPVAGPEVIQACAQANNCLGDNTVEIVVEGGQQPYSYQWMREGALVATTANLSEPIPGEYTLTVTDAAGRQASGFFSVVPERYLQLADAQVWSTSCVGASDGRIALQVDNGSGQYAYSWSHGADTPELAGLVAGHYTVTVTDVVTGCSETAQFEVYDGRPRPVGIEVDAAACNAAIGAVRLQLNGSYSFLWSNGATTEDIDSLAAGTYTVTITHEQGCFARSIQVPELEGPYFTTAVTQPECGGNNGSIEVQAPGENLSFLWSTGEQGPVLSGLAAGQYQLTVSNGDGCASSAGFQLVSGSLLAVPAVSCRPDGAELLYTVWDGGQPPYTFAWSTGHTEVSSLSSKVDGLADGVYTVSVTDAAGCTYIVDTLRANCTGPQLELQLSGTCRSYADTAFTVIEAVVAGGEAPYTFEWSNGTVEEHDGPSRIAVADNGFFSVQVRDASGQAFAEQWIQVFCLEQEQASLRISDALVYNGEAATLDVRLGPVFGLDSLRLPLYWASPQLRLDSITAMQLPGLSTDNFELETYTAGAQNFRLLNLNWSNPDALPVAAEEGFLLFRLHFSVDALPGAAEFVRWGDEWLGGEVELFLDNGAALPLATDNGRVDIRYYSNAAPLVLKAQEQIAATHSFACIEVKADNFSEMIAAQFSLQWDPDTLRFHSIQAGELPGLDESSFGLAGTDGGQLNFSWSTNAPRGLSVPAGTPLFSVCFETAAAPGFSALRFISGTVPIQASAYTGVLAYAVQHGGLSVLVPDVWPGDTDANATAGHFDLLNIGLAYNATGPPRPVGGTAWQGHIAEQWWQELPRSGVNFKHIDADGNGRIDAADTVSITQHWGAANPSFVPEAPLFGHLPNLALHTPFYVDAQPVEEGQHATFDIILGEALFPARNVYGIAFTIRYDTAAAAPGSAAIGLNDSWLGNGLLTLSRNHEAGDAIDVAITRTNRTDAFGFGPIAQLQLLIRDAPQSHNVHFRIENVRLLDRDERPVWVRTPETTAPIGRFISGTDNRAAPELLNLFPNPTRGLAFLETNGVEVQRMELYQTGGSRVGEWMGATASIDLRGYAQGLYFLKIFTDRGVVVKGISVVR